MIRFTISHPLEFLKIRPLDRSQVVIYINGVELKQMSSEFAVVGKLEWDDVVNIVETTDEWDRIGPDKGVKADLSPLQNKE